MPNTLAYLVLLFWPVVILGLFLTRPPRTALIWSVLLSYLFLPQRAAFNFPGLPSVDRTSLPAFTILACLLLIPRQRPRLIPTGIKPNVLLFVLFVAPLGTVLLNGSPVTWGPTTLPGLRIYDWLSLSFGTLVTILPLLFGRALLAEPDAHRELLRALLVAGLVYSVPMLFEVRMSPQLHNWIYGFFQHQFLQQIRFGGFRPMVFLIHGLSVALFAAMAVAAAATLWRAAKTPRSAPAAEVPPAEEQRPAAAGVPGQRRRERRRAGQPSRMKLLAITVYLFAVLVLCKTVGALVLALAILPLIILAPVRLQALVGGAFAVILFSYPILRGADAIPDQAITGFFRAVTGEVSAGSLQFRFEHENRLIDHANQRPLFGWGTWGRNRVFDEDTGRDISVTDGAWVIRIGSFGWIGYVSLFGLLTLPLISVARLSLGSRQHVETVGLGLILGINLLYLIPNSDLSPLTWLMAGALLGYAERERAAERERRQARRGRRMPAGIPQAAPVPARRQGRAAARAFPVGTSPGRS